jgi:hypothetical protein
MPVIGLKFNQAKALFFDRQPVMNAVSRAERRVLSKFGAFVRRRARSSIRKRKAISEPGKPPSSHTGVLRQTIFFVYEPQRASVVIGPVELNRGTEAPRLLEHGGQAVRREGQKRVRMTYRPRPFMGPAYEREVPKLPALWRDSVR